MALTLQTTEETLTFLDQSDRVQYRGWLAHIEVSGNPSGQGLSGHADLRLNGEQKCMLVLATNGSYDRAAARAELIAKARHYIDRWGSGPVGTHGSLLSMLEH